MNIEKGSKKRVYVDMDNVLVDFKSGIEKLDKQISEKYKDNPDDAPNIFSLMDPIPDAIKSYELLAEKYDVYILSTAPWNNPSAWSDKLIWVQTYLGEVAYKRLILTHHKDFLKGDYLIDDRLKHGAKDFEGELILFGSDRYKNWADVKNYLLG